jgi:hypothetical protein
MSFFSRAKKNANWGGSQADRLKPPIRNRLMVRIDYTMTKQMLSSD